jgi:hypothetical protein
MPDVKLAPAMTNAKSVKPTRDEQRKVAELIEAKGVVEAAEKVGCARETLMRVAAGLSVRAGTMALVRERLG